VKRELALQLLQGTLPDLAEQSLADIFRELQFLAEYKYNKYEMYQPGRLFLENLYLWLEQFSAEERQEAVDFIRQNLIFISRDEFHQLAHVLYYDVIRSEQISASARLLQLPVHRVAQICSSPTFDLVERASLYIAMSDGSRIDYIRRQHLAINNEQVVPHYEASPDKITQLTRDLRAATNDSNALFRCAFFIDDFCGSGKTLLREIVTSPPLNGGTIVDIPSNWLGRLSRDRNDNSLHLQYTGPPTDAEKDSLRNLSTDKSFQKGAEALIKKADERDTELRGSLTKIAKSRLRELLEPDGLVFFSPLLATEHAIQRLEPLIKKLSAPFDQMQIRPAATIDGNVTIVDGTSPIGRLCEKYYLDELADEHTGNVRFGYDHCGLPLVLHHNSPNNSIYPLWNRRAHRSPLFVRYERHGREGV
jgi:hypothetical protein